MNKVIIKESGKKHISVEIVLYILYAAVGFLLLNLSVPPKGVTNKLI